MTLQCNACGGIYDDVGPDGLRYFHACPPLSVRELRAALEAGTLDLTVREQLALNAAVAADAGVVRTADEASAVDVFLASLTKPRPDARDENVDLAKAAAADAHGRRANPDAPDESRMTAVGRGVTRL